MTLTEAREVLRKHLPEVRLRPRPADAWQGPEPLPPPVLAYYDVVGPDDVEIETLGNLIYLPSLTQLWALQAGYRYLPETGEHFGDWQRAWLVVGYEGGDAYIFDAGTNSVLFALHGLGAWEPRPLFADLAEMAAVLGALGGIVTGAGDDLADDNGDIRAAYVTAAHDALAAVVPDPERRASMLKALGWGGQPN